MPIRTCFFDMGNVLVFFSHDRMCQNVADLCGIPLATVRQVLLESGLNSKLERGEISEEEFHEEFQTMKKLTVDIDQLKHAVSDIFWLNESMLPLLNELKSLGMRLVLLSNTSVTHLRFIQRNFDVLNPFDDFVASYTVGALKPDAAIYEAAAAQAKCVLQDCFYTDDIEEYVLKARTFGIHSEIYTDTKSTRASLRALGVDLSE